MYFSKTSLGKDIAEADSSIADLEEQVSELEEQSLDEATVAQEVIALLEASEVLWSEVIGDLLEVTPLDIYYSSYSGNENGYVTVNALGDSYYAVADLIEVLADDSKFEDVFVPSVSSVSGGDEMVTFSFGFTYDDSKTAR